jgi:serine/threonine protein phosphatase 1
MRKMKGYKASLDSIFGKRIFCFTDIHGRKTFFDLINQLDIDYDNDWCVFGGDFLDRGDHEYEVFCKLVEMKEKMKERMIWLLGNHEDALLYLYRYKLPLNARHREMAEKLDKMDLKSCYEFDELAFVHGEFSESNNDDLLNRYGGKQICQGEKIYSGKLFIAGHNEVDFPCYVNEEGKKDVLKDGMVLPGKGAIFYDTGYNPDLKKGGNLMTALIIEDRRIHIVQRMDIG